MKSQRNNPNVDYNPKWDIVLFVVIVVILVLGAIASILLLIKEVLP